MKYVGKVLENDFYEICRKIAKRKESIFRL